METVRDHFVKTFGETEAEIIETAATGHENSVNGEKKGDDPFKWAILIAIGYGCMKDKKSRQYHGIKTPYSKLKRWIIENGELASHKGDMDYLALMCGKYNEFIPKEEKV